MTEPRGLAGGVEAMRDALKKEGNDRMLDVVDGFGQRGASEMVVGFALLVEQTDLVRFRAWLSVAAATEGRTSGLSRTGRTGGAGVMVTHANWRTGGETASGADRWPRCAP